MISQNGDWTEACYQSSLAGGSGWQLNLGELMPNNFHIFSMQRRIPIKKIQLHFLIIQIYLFIYSESFLNIRHFWKQVVCTYYINMYVDCVYKETDTMDIVTLSWISMTLKRKCPKENSFNGRYHDIYPILTLCSMKIVFGRIIKYQEYLSTFWKMLSGWNTFSHFLPAPPRIPS